MHYFYLHGWASSPLSTKAQFFKQQFEQLGIQLHIPDLNQDNFYELTFTRQLQQVAQLIEQHSEVVLLGSSLGGLTALWLAQRFMQVKQIVLFAPALNFLNQCQTLLGHTAFQTWQQQRELPIFHHATQQLQLLNFNFIEDMQQYKDEQLTRALPTLMFHGKQDEVIAVNDVKHFAQQRDWVQLHLLNSDHHLTNVQTFLWQTSQQFLHLTQ